MQRQFAKIETIEDVGTLIYTACHMIAEYGVVRESYHLVPAFASPTSMTASIHTIGFSEEWMRLYNDADFRDKDPIPARVLEKGAMMTWREAIDAGPNSAANLEYFAAMKKYGLVHGFGVPLFGSKSYDGYAAFDFGKPLSDVSDNDVGMVRALAQLTHQRVCMLLIESDPSYELSEREEEVLTWLAKGKSIWAVATILELSPDTVKTYAKRIYGKLGVSDRIGAVVKGLKLGLIKT